MKIYVDFWSFLKIVFYSRRDASHLEICFMIHSHISWPHSGDCEGSRIRTQTTASSVWYPPVALEGQSHEKVYEFLTWDGSFSLN
jgi:hypothetical protein